MKEYKAVSGPQIIEVKKGEEQNAFNLFGDIINAECSYGWEYHSMETITVASKSGCGGLQVENSNHYMLIFQREVK